ncbi:glutamine synthetase [Candidatus Bathyarchaeota archaeon]|nr:glutamine synthetase [Candidatus Bathyarchaeota archaeon]
MSPKLTNPESVEPIMERIKNQDIKYVRLIIIDLNGMPRAMIIPEYEIPVALKNGIGFDGSSMGLVNIENSDLTAHPDPSTFLTPMWETPGLAIMFCYLSNPDGSPFLGDSRGLLKTTLEELEKKNMGYNTGPELEYFYVTQNNGSISPYGSGGYFFIPPNDPTENIKLETMMCLEAAGFQLDKIHHEVAQGQQEINFRYNEALRTADNAVLYKLVVKTIAQKYGVTATFMPKPFWGVNGSGCHVHQSISDLKTGRNLFGDSSSETGLSKMAYHFMAGILAHSKAMSMIVAPTVNSYKRLVPHYEAPVYITWGLGNRSALVRVPLYPGDKSKVRRIEYRHPDPSCNPYLSATVMLKAGLEGIKKKLEPSSPEEENVYHLTNQVEILPENLGEAVTAFSEDKIISEALGEYISKRLTLAKKAEYDSYMKFVGTDWNTSRPRITSWELEKYLTTC